MHHQHRAERQRSIHADQERTASQHPGQQQSLPREGEEHAEDGCSIDRLAQGAGGIQRELGLKDQQQARQPGGQWTCETVRQRHCDTEGDQTAEEAHALRREHRIPDDRQRQGAEGIVAGHVVHVVVKKPAVENPANHREVSVVALFPAGIPSGQPESPEQPGENRERDDVVPAHAPILTPDVLWGPIRPQRRAGLG